jgi:hypothetical protein
MAGNWQYENRERIPVYFERDELEELRRFAHTHCMNLSQLLRRVALRYLAQHSGPQKGT